MTIAISGKAIGDGNPVFITFEAGPTHDGLETAKKLVTVAAKAGADAVKFQILDPERLVADKKQLFSYEILADRQTNRTKTISEPLYDILMRRCLTRQEWRELKQYCDEKGLIFFSTATFEDEMDFLEELGCDTVKICSGDIDHFPFIEYCAKSGMVIQLDTGNATLGEAEKAVDKVLQTGNNRIIIHQCPSGYPARLESINLRVIPTLRKMFDVPVAFSDHTPGWIMDIAAISLGATMIEKTITLNRATPQVEHIFSLEPEEAVRFVRDVRQLETAFGTPRKIMTAKERKSSLAVRRSLVLRKDVRAGEKIMRQFIDFARPGFGIRPECVNEIINHRAITDLKAGQMLRWEDLS